MRRNMSLLNWLSGLAFACATALCCPETAHAALNARDLHTRVLESNVADEPRAAVRESEALKQQAVKRGDKTQLLRALRLMVMAAAQLEESISLAKLTTEGLLLARELRDAQAETEFLAAKAIALSSTGKFLDAQLEFDEAINVAVKAGLKRAATGVMVSKAFVHGLLGRDTDFLDLLFKAYRQCVEMGDDENACSTLSAIGNA